MYTAIASNKRKTLLLIAIFIAFVSTLGYLFGKVAHNPTFFYFFGIGSLVYAIISYYLSDKIALKMSGAKPVTKKQAPELYRLVENLSIAAGLPMPKVYIIDDPSPNAFATGRDPKHSAVAVTTGLLENLEKEELEGVLAHELAHIGNYDIRLMSVVAALVSIVSLISDFFMWGGGLFGGDEEGNSPLTFLVSLAAALLAPLIAIVIQLAISRRREYLADATGAMTTRYPEGLARALQKISQSQPMHHSSSATAHLFISNPFGGDRGISAGIANLFSTHPPIQDRIKRLQAMGSQV